MDYAAASFFDGCQFQHIAAWQEQRRLQRIRERDREMIKGRLVN